MKPGGDKTLLTLDRGNTTLDCRLSGAFGVRRQRLEPRDTAALLGFLGEDRIDLAAGCTVVAGGLERPREVLAARGVRLLLAGRDLPSPLIVGYDDASELGVDRWVGAVGARHRFGDALVVDCGTAVTIGLVRRDGRFQPGPIGAGLTTIARALGDRAPALPAFDGGPPVTWPPRGTLDAVRAGVGRGFACAVEALATRLIDAARIHSEPGWAPARVVTGGDAARFVALAEGAWLEVADLVHQGLCQLCLPCGSSC